MWEDVGVVSPPVASLWPEKLDPSSDSLIGIYFLTRSYVCLRNTCKKKKEKKETLVAGFPLKFIQQIIVFII